jgi:hypothetical protein
MGSLSIWHWIVVFVYVLVLIVPVAKILKKAGFSGWWSIVALIPGVNIIFLWIFALVKWPSALTAAK